MRGRIPIVAAVVVLAAHLAGNPHYGFYRDELYFIVCGWRPDFGYVDQPPLVPLLAALSQLFGHSLFALRAVPALFAAGAVYVTCLLVEELGGSAFAVALGALVAATTPILEAFGTTLSTDVAGLVLWPLMALFALRALRGDPRYWLFAGLACGVACEAKYSAALFAIAIVAGIALTQQRRALIDRWFLAGAAIAAAVALPSLIWQAAHGFPIVEMLHNQQATADVPHSPVEYVLQQFIITNPITAPLWIAGVAYAFAHREIRWIGWTCMILIGLFAILDGKNYYAGDLYSLPIAAGAVAIERIVKRPAWRSSVIAVCCLAAVATVPLVMPILPETQIEALAASVHPYMKVDLAPERNAQAPLGQLYADMHGWPEMVAAVAKVYASLPPEKRKQTAILASNWGEAAAIDYYGSEYGLPPAISGHNNYYFWGTRGFDGSTVIEVNGSCTGAVEYAARHPGVAHAYDRWAMPQESDIPISLCERSKRPLAAYWPRLKSYL